MLSFAAGQFIVRLSGIERTNPAKPCRIRDWQYICSTNVEIIDMPSRIYLGELEELILLMVALLNKEAYGVSIAEELQKQAGRDISISAVHAVLHRLEEKAFVKSRMGGATAERGGRRKRLFAITAYGRSALEELRDTRNQIWDLIARTAFS